MKSFLSSLLAAAALALGSPVLATTVEWSAADSNGFSLQNGSELPAGSLVRLGHFRDPVSGVALSDVQIQAMKASPVTLNGYFVEIGSALIGDGYTPAIPGHFSASANVTDEALIGSLAGRQMVLWVLNAPTVAAATQQAIVYWSVGDLSAHPDGELDKPGNSWRFPAESLLPGQTVIDLTDLTVGRGILGSGARVVVGTYPCGASSALGMAGSPNFGLAELEQPLDVVTPAQLAGGTVGAGYSQSLAAVEGRPGYTWTLTGGNLPSGLSMNAQGLISGVPSFAGRYNFMVTATDAASSSVSKNFTLVIASVPLQIATSARLPDAGRNAAYAQQIIAQGGTAPYSWELVAGSLPGGISLDPVAGNLLGTAAVAGQSNFDLKCTDAGGLSVTTSFSLTVRAVEVLTLATLDAAVLNRGYTQLFEARGGKGPYLWSLASGALPPGAQLNAQGQLSFLPRSLTTHTFGLRVEDSLGNQATREFTLPVFGSMPRPVIDPPQLAPLMVGEMVQLRLTATNRPTRFAVTGLPAGLSLNAATGVISGRPRASGSFPLRITATNEGGPGTLAVNPGFDVQALPAGVVGSFMGAIAHSSDLNGNLGGRMDLSVTELGAYSMKLNQGGRESSFAGTLDVARNQTPRLTLTAAGFKLQLVLDERADLLSGSITSLAVGGGSASVMGWRRVWRLVSKPATSRQGYYTMGLEVTSPIIGSPVPEGTGFARCVVGADGGISLAGKVADGSPITSAGFIGPNGEVLLYQLLYAKLGSVVGRLAITENPVGSLSNNIIAGLLTWLKPASNTRVYPRGFGPLTLGVHGMYLAAGLTSSNFLGMPDPLLPLALSFAAGGVESSAINPNVPALTYLGPGAVRMPQAGSTANPAAASLAIPYAASGTTVAAYPFTNVRTGFPNGSVFGGFRLIDPNGAGGQHVRNVAFEGMIIRSADSSTKAFGFFLLPQLPTAGQTLSNSPILSGQMTLSQ